MLIGYYNNKYPERLASLLRKISHEIISRCRTRVSLSDILYADSINIKASMVLLTVSLRPLHDYITMLSSGCAKRVDSVWCSVEMPVLSHRRRHSSCLSKLAGAALDI